MCLATVNAESNGVVILLPVNALDALSHRYVLNFNSAWTMLRYLSTLFNTESKLWYHIVLDLLRGIDRRI